MTPNDGFTATVEDNYQEKIACYAFSIALVVLVIVGFIVSAIVLGDLYRNSPNVVTDTGTTIGYFSGWIATIITFYFGQSTVNAEKKDTQTIRKNYTQLETAKGELEKNYQTLKGEYNQLNETYKQLFGKIKSEEKK